MFCVCVCVCVCVHVLNARGQVRSRIGGQWLQQVHDAENTQCQTQRLRILQVRGQEFTGGNRWSHKAGW